MFRAGRKIGAYADFFPGFDFVLLRLEFATDDLDGVASRQKPFSADPRPTTRWTTHGGRKHPRSDPHLRPSNGTLSANGRRQPIVILDVMFAWLVQADHLACKPPLL
ncbi:MULTISPECIES: hypothetical protein [Burkholderiaceae]|uniref:hypothetical protein n=1 Tax=Paraburkholderia domus TaxID=2793075 RepID=UPI001914343C|nr:hypothetical protein [Burkholderia sp. R-70006]MBK5066232.1 hypothetical protein [Burkholderia sp. R-70199]MBK5169745.1 hypothetical protein [Burkholderia sp. R-70211]MBK5185447.1 hypothetical protein [Burkholderia sp. R-69749]